METLINIFREYFTELMIGGGFTLAGLKWFVVDKLKSTKLGGDLVRFDTSVKDFSRKVEKIGEVVYDKLLSFEDRMKLLETENEGITKENILLMNLAIEALSVANIPLSAKEKFYSGLNDLSHVNKKVGETFEALIKTQKILADQSEKENKEIADKLEDL